MSHIDLMKKHCLRIIIAPCNTNMLTFRFIKFLYYGSLFLLWKMPRFFLMTQSVTCITKTFFAILFLALKTWHFNFLANKRSYSFKKIIFMRRWNCIVYKFFLLFILNILNHSWRQCIKGNEWNNLFKRQIDYKVYLLLYRLFFQFTFKMPCYEYIYAMLWIKS